MEKIKHNHCLTDILKVCLFSLLMIAPLLASVSQILYVTLNKNAKDSYYGETINNYSFVEENYQDLVIEQTYYFSNDLVPTLTPSQTYTYLNVQNLEFISNPPQTSADLSATNRLQFYINGDGNARVYLMNNNTNLDLIPLNTMQIEFKFDYFGGNNLNVNQDFFSYLHIKSIVYNKYSYLDNAFYYGVDQMTKSDLFNWTQNTGIYTGVHAMTNGIGIESIFIPMLLTYWLVLTIVYIIIDVVIETFKYLTHMLQNKVKSKTS